MTPLRWIVRALGGVAGLSLLAALALLAFIPAASADLKRGVAAYNRGDYPTALRELESAAQGGNADAQYHVGAMYAEGRGTPRQDVLALKWLNCAAEGSGGMLVKAKAKFWRAVYGFRNKETAGAGRAMAVSACGIDSGEAAKSYHRSRAESEMDRSNWLMNLLLYPGDMIIQAFLGLGEELATDWIGRAFVQLFEWMGDVFPGILAVLAWGGSGASVSLVSNLRPMECPCRAPPDIEATSRYGERRRNPSPSAKRKPKTRGVEVQA